MITTKQKRDIETVITMMGGSKAIVELPRTFTSKSKPDTYGAGV